MQGKVYLVGAGPGDLELLTRKAFRLIKEADCLIYDRLIDVEILKETKEDCECIYVGKANHHHTMKQDDINELLVEKSRQYACVVRLKGGDVYVFGRGGEEGLYLKKHDIPFETVPGISSCIAGLAYAGIPITHRGITSGFRVFTAHNCHEELSNIDFMAIAKSTDTCVFLMGLSKLEEIVNKLLKAGKDKNCKIAVISNATLPKQDVVVSSLEHISEEIRKHPLSSPALIVIGEVISLREQLNFFEEKPLFHKHVLLPRVGQESSKLTFMLKQMGANVKEVQVSRLKEYKEALDHVHYEEYTHIVLTSRHAITYFMNSLRKNDIDIRSLAHIHFAVVGSASKAELKKYGIKADLVPESYESEELLEMLLRDINTNSRVLIPMVNIGQEKWGGLKKHCLVDVITLYENEAVEEETLLKIMDESWDMAIFTCSSAVNNTLKYGTLKAKYIISIGKMTSKTLKEWGIKNFYQSKQATYDSILDLIGKF